MRNNDAHSRLQLIHFSILFVLHLGSPPESLRCTGALKIRGTPEKLFVIEFINTKVESFTPLFSYKRTPNVLSVILRATISQPVITCLKLTIVTIEQGAKYV